LSRVTPVGLDHRQNCALGNEAGDVVNVAVRVVTGDAAAEPEHLLDAEIVGEYLLVVALLEARVAVLDLAQQALFGCQ
jgi:hypothetical protein